MRSVRRLGCAFVVTASLGCAAAPPPASKPAVTAAASESNAAHLVLEGSAAETIERYGTGLPAYDLTDAVWLSNAPVAVNSAYDFSTAMMMDDVGPGLAAAQRQKRNAEMAEQLAPLRLSPEALAHLAALRAQGIHRYALFFGSPDALQLRIVTDRFDEQGLLSAHAVNLDETLPATEWTTERLSNALLKE